MRDGTSALWPNWGVPRGHDGSREAMPILENGTSLHFFCVTVLTGADGGSYNAFIDGGAANEQRLKSRLRLLVTTATRLVVGRMTRL